jgi:hypothetical protein
VSELYLPNDSRLSAKLVQTLRMEGGVAWSLSRIPYDRNLDSLDQANILNKGLKQQTTCGFVYLVKSDLLD